MLIAQRWRLETLTCPANHRARHPGRRVSDTSKNSEKAPRADDSF